MMSRQSIPNFSTPTKQYSVQVSDNYNIILVYLWQFFFF